MKACNFNKQGLNFKVSEIKSGMDITQIAAGEDVVQMLGGPCSRVGCSKIIVIHR